MKVLKVRREVTALLAAAVTAGVALACAAGQAPPWQTGPGAATTQAPVGVVSPTASAAPGPATASQATPSPGSMATLQPGNATPGAYAEPVGSTVPAALTLEAAPSPGAPSGVEFLGVLPAADVARPAWSPDGSLLAYVIRAADARAVEVLRPADSMLVSRWTFPPNGLELIWSPRGSRLYFLEQRHTEGTATIDQRISWAQVGDADWHELVVWEVPSMSLNEWLDDETLLCWAPAPENGCMYAEAVDVISGELTGVNTVWESPEGELCTRRFLFSADHQWLAATDHLEADPRTVAGPRGGWGDVEGMMSLATGLGVRYTEPEFWSGHSLAFLARTPGAQGTSHQPPPADLYLWSTESGERRLLGRGVLGAYLDPTGSRVAALLVGSPQMGSDGVLSAEPSVPHLALLSWPEWQLLGSAPAGPRATSPWQYYDHPAVPWSPDGTRLVFEAEGGGLAWMDREGNSGSLLAGEPLKPLDRWSAEWGADHLLALLVDGRIWLLRVP